MSMFDNAAAIAADGASKATRTEQRLEKLLEVLLEKGILDPADIRGLSYG
jgi:polyhydroxyalkanoate synthesis regulator phasin